jgi:hypothetical protein
VAPHVVPHSVRGQNRHFKAHSVSPPVERTGVAAWLSSPGTDFPASPAMAGPLPRWPWRERSFSYECDSLLLPFSLVPRTWEGETLADPAPLLQP